MKVLPDISIVIPVFNESENISNLAHEIHTSLNGFKYEVIFVDDASTDNTKEKIKELKKAFFNSLIFSFVLSVLASSTKITSYLKPLREVWISCARLEIFSLSLNTGITIDMSGNTFMESI